MEEDSGQAIELHEAQSLIYNSCSPLPGEQIRLAESLGRFSLDELTAQEALPGYDQSLRDGYAIRGTGTLKIQAFPCSFQIVDEVAAGDTRTLVLQPGDAIRIMTGGLVPAHCTAVVPEESCSVSGDILTVPLSQKKNFICRKGSELVQGQVVLPQGNPIRSEKVIMLAGVGYNTVELARKPRVSFFCTGSELVVDADGKRAGQKFSANTPLLENLIRQAGAIFQEQQSVVDDLDAVTETMLKLAEAVPDILISTGGMGSGKFDLIEESFCRAGGKVLYRSIRLRPGKATLFGTLGNTLFFGMPGPPPAVSLLFNELIRPAILRLQGAKQCGPVKRKALLAEEMTLPKRALPRLKGGVISLEDGRFLVRQARRKEVANCHIYCPEGRRKVPKGELVSVHLLPSSPLFS